MKKLGSKPALSGRLCILLQHHHILTKVDPSQWQWMQVCANVKKMNPMELDILVNCQWTNKLLQVTSGTSLNFPIDFDNGTKPFHRRTNGGHWQPSKIIVINSCLTRKLSWKCFQTLPKYVIISSLGKKLPKSKSTFSIFLLQGLPCEGPLWGTLHWAVPGTHLAVNFKLLSSGEEVVTDFAAELVKLPSVGVPSKVLETFNSKFLSVRSTVSEKFEGG